MCFTRSLATHLHWSTLMAVCQELLQTFCNSYIVSNLGKLKGQRLCDGVRQGRQANSNNWSGKVNRLDHPNGSGFASSLDVDLSWPIPRTDLNLSVNMKSGGSPGRVTFTLTLIITCHLWARCVQLVRSAVWHVIHDTSTRWRHLGVWEYFKCAASSAAAPLSHLGGWIVPCNPNQPPHSQNRSVWWLRLCEGAQCYNESANMNANKPSLTHTQHRGTGTRHHPEGTQSQKTLAFKNTNKTISDHAQYRW